MEFQSIKEVYPYQNHYRVFLTLASPDYVRESLFYLSQQTNKFFSKNDYLSAIARVSKSNTVVLTSANIHFRHHLQKVGIVESHRKPQLSFRYLDEFSLNPQVDNFLRESYIKMKKQFPESDFSFMEFTNKTTSEKIYPSITSLKFLQIAEIVSKTVSINSKNKKQDITIYPSQIFQRAPTKKERDIMNSLLNKDYLEIIRRRRGLSRPHESYRLTQKGIQTIQTIRLISGR